MAKVCLLENNRKSIDGEVEPRIIYKQVRFLSRSVRNADRYVWLTWLITLQSIRSAKNRERKEI